MNSQVRRTLNETIIQACKNTFLEDEKLKTIKDIAKKGDDFIKCAFDQLWHQLNAKNSQTRFVALLICYELFKRSKKFRELLTDEFPQFIEYTIVGGKPTENQRETSTKYKTHLYKRRSNSASITATVLPPPENFANQLRTTSLKFIEEWNEAYGSLYKKLSLGYNYIKNVLHFKFPEMRNQNLIRQQEEEERSKQMQLVLQAKFNQIKSQFEESVLNMMLCLKQMDVCFNMIVPTLEDLEFTDDLNGAAPVQNEQPAVTQTSETQTNEETVSEAEPSTVDDVSHEEQVDAETEQQNEDDEDDWEVVDTEFTDDLQDLVNEYGLGSINYHLTIKINRSFDDLRSAENEEMYALLKENLTEIERNYEPMVNEWIRALSTVKMEGQDALKCEKMLKKCLEFREWITSNKEKCENLKITPSAFSNRQFSMYKVPELSISDLKINLGKRKEPPTKKRSVNKKRKT